MRWLALAAALFILAPQPVYGWGDEGHRFTGYIANSYLTEETRIQLRDLVGTDDLAQLATWLDDERDALNRRFPGSSRWHYENRDACSDTSSAAKICPRGQCITRQIERSRAVLKNPQATRAQRADAVRILIHLLGDLHQPLHLIDNDDRGGNDFYVRLPRERDPRRLHEVWDTSLLRMNLRRTGSASYARKLLTRFDAERAVWQAGTVDQWAGETHAVALQYAYQSLPEFACRLRVDSAEAKVLPATYIDSARIVIDSQLAKAGVRMAVVLNEALDAATPAPAIH